MFYQIIFTVIIMFVVSKGVLKLINLFNIRGFTSVTVPGRRRIRSKKDMDLKCREDPIVTKLDSPQFKNIFTQEVKDLKKLFDKYQYEIRIAGGAVRDLVMGLQPKDLDFATVATPAQMKEMFTKEEIRMINMNGEKHGTITPRINDKENFEVTTLRIDMVTDGRHADVQFTTDWKLDANRRDLTINSMFLGFDGSLYDYFFGYEDLQKKRVAFVGDADVRIKEDCLRIMRYFRFYGKIAEKPDNHEEETLKIISDNVEGLQHISGERIWMELKKTLQGNFAGDLLITMLKTNIGPYIGLPTVPNLDELHKLIRRGQHLHMHPMCYLVALLKDMDDVTILHSRLKFSAYDRDLAYFLIEHRGDKVSTRPLLPYQKLVLAKTKQNVGVEYVSEVLKYRGDEDLLNELKNWQIPKFPIGGKEMKQHGVPPGIMYGKTLQKLKNIWIENDFRQTSDDLIKCIPEIIEEFERNKNKTK